MALFQEKQKDLSILMSQIRTPKYQEVIKDMGAITQAKVLWTSEMQTLDSKMQDYMKSSGSGTNFNTDPEFKELVEQRSTLMKSFRESSEYKEYVAKNQSKLESLREERMRMLTPEIIELQKEISELRRETSGGAVIK